MLTSFYVIITLIFFSVTHTDLFCIQIFYNNPLKEEPFFCCATKVILDCSLLFLISFVILKSNSTEKKEK